MNMKFSANPFSFASTAAITLALTLSVAYPAENDREGGQEEGIQHVLLVSVDGLHAVDLANYIKAHPNSALAQLSRHGITYPQASCSKPSDSFPGLLAMVTGGSPGTTGVYYDDSYDRLLLTPLIDGDGNPLGGNTPGTEIVYDETIDFDLTRPDAGGGINPQRLPRDPVTLAPVYPHSFLRVNTIFEIAKKANLRTAWSDKHPAYDIVNGPSGNGVDDLFTPEINSYTPESATTTRVVNTSSLRGTETMEEIFELSLINNPIPVSETNVFGGYNNVPTVNDLSDLFVPGAIPAPPSVSVNGGGFMHDRRTGHVSQVVQIANTGTTPVPAPLWLVLDNLSPTVTLFNADGTTAVLAPLGSPYISVGVGDDDVLRPHEIKKGHIGVPRPEGR